MAFSDDVRQELTRVPCEKRCCAHATLLAMILCSGGLAFRGMGRYAVTISSESAAVVRTAFALLRKWTEVSPELRTARRARLGERVFYQIQLEGEDASRVLETLGLLDPKAAFGLRFAPPASSVRRDCCRRAYLRGAYMVCGWANDPRKGYSVEFAASDESQAETVSRVLSRISVPAKIAPRKNQFAAYVKDGEHIATLLAALGASGALMAFENARAMRETRNAVNRQVNCDAGNLEKTVSAAQRQISDIEYLRESIGLEKLPAQLRQVAEARLSNAELSLAELGELLDPPIGKSGVNNRLRRLSALAEELKIGG